MLDTPIKIVTRWIPADGLSFWPFVFLSPFWANNRGLLAHEREHLEEQALPHTVWWFLLAAFAPSWWFLLAVPITPWWLAYLLWPAFRLRAELVAYRTQIRVGGIGIDEAARNLSENYRLDLSLAEATRLLQTGDA